jgi:hypothetical protein
MHWESQSGILLVREAGKGEGNIEPGAAIDIPQ